MRYISRSKKDTFCIQRRSCTYPIYQRVLKSYMRNICFQILDPFLATVCWLLVLHEYNSCICYTSCNAVSCILIYCSLKDRKALGHVAKHHACHVLGISYLARCVSAPSIMDATICLVNCVYRPWADAQWCRYKCRGESDDVVYCQACLEVHPLQRPIQCTQSQVAHNSQRR